MEIQEIIDEVLSRFDGLVVSNNWGEKGLFYNPDNLLPKGIYLLTFKEKDGPNDKASCVDRKDVFRLNLGISKKTFTRIFGSIPKRPSAGQIIDMPYDFTRLNEIMPHPVYGWMSWISVLNPDIGTFKQLLPLIEEGHSLAVEKYKRRIKDL